jgi:hypothetical protein
VSRNGSQAMLDKHKVGLGNGYLLLSLSYAYCPSHCHTRDHGNTLDLTHTHKLDVATFQDWCSGCTALGGRIANTPILSLEQTHGVHVLR